MSMVALASHNSGFAFVFDNIYFIWVVWSDNAYPCISLLLGVFSLGVGMRWGPMKYCVIDCDLDYRL